MRPAASRFFPRPAVSSGSLLLGRARRLSRWSDTVPASGTARPGHEPSPPEARAVEMLVAEDPLALPADSTPLQGEVVPTLLAGVVPGFQDRHIRWQLADIGWGI